MDVSNNLDLINDPIPEHRSRTYVHAFLLCFCALVKVCLSIMPFLVHCILFQGEADAQHLFFGRRASARVQGRKPDAIDANKISFILVVNHV